VKFLTIISCGLIAAGIAYPAGAGAFGQEMGFRPLAQDQRPRPEQQRGADQPMPQRDMRGTDANERRRMNPEERRQLRRDIQDAGKDIYRPARQERGEQRRSGRR
jgi:hypothetical protein